MNNIQEKKHLLHSETCKKLGELYQKKNHDYDDAFAKRFAKRGMIYPVDKMQEKLDRVEALSRQSQSVEGESMMDSLMDLANYAIMTLIELSINKASA